MRLSASYSYVIVMISVWCHRRCSAFVVSYSKRSQYFSSLLGSRVINNRNPWSLLQDSLHTDTDREAVEYSLFTQDATFNSIGVNEKLIDALSLAGFSKATHIQAMAFDPVMSGKDVMIGSETGSGKTLAYLLPLMHGLLSRTEEEIEKNEKEFPSAAIVVPNKQLANQVFTMTKAITAGLQTTLTVETVAGVYRDWPYRRGSCPEILICTPNFLSYFAHPSADERTPLFKSMRSLILDEADMLLEGSYQADLELILDARRLVRRGMIRNDELQVHEQFMQTVLSAATIPTYGLRSTEMFIKKKFPNIISIKTDNMHRHHPAIQQEFIMCAQDTVQSEDRLDLIVDAILGSTAGNVDSNKEVTAPTMVFANTAASARWLANSMKLRGIDCVEFHSLLNNEEKDDSLQIFKKKECNLLICTDSASRGFDIPHVEHVIQAEFAGNVVHHLHRIGRASRAGKAGKATMFYDKRSQDLVKSIMNSRDTDCTVEESFSRRRGFRKKIKKNYSN